MSITAKCFVSEQGAYLGAWDGYKRPNGSFCAPVYPSGAIEVPEPPQDGRQTWRDGRWADALVVSDQVDIERDRRIDAGFSFGGASYQSRPSDRENIAGAATAAGIAMLSGAEAGDLRWHGGDEDFAWIAADNSTRTMDAQTMFAFGQAAMAHKSNHIFAARALKDMQPIPTDYATSAAYWPSTE